MIHTAGKRKGQNLNPGCLARACALKLEAMAHSALPRDSRCRRTHRGQSQCLPCPPRGVSHCLNLLARRSGGEEKGDSPVIPTHTISAEQQSAGVPFLRASLCIFSQLLIQGHHVGRLEIFLGWEYLHLRNWQTLQSKLFHWRAQLLNISQHTASFCIKT